MRNIDLTPLHRFTIGFDRMQREFDRLAHMDDTQVSYPPYNIEVMGDDQYRITMAVAGFGEDDLEISIENSELTVSGRIEETQDTAEFLHRGIAARAFERHFALADHIKIRGASLDNGLLHIELMRELPEALKPRKIEIKSTSAKALEHKAA